MDLFIKTSVLLAIFCWLRGVEVMICLLKESVVGKKTIQGVWGYLMSRIAATCYLSGSRLGVVFDDFGSTHCGKKKLRKPVLTTPIFTLIIPALLYLFTCCCHAYTRPTKLNKMIWWNRLPLEKKRDRRGTVVICRRKGENVTVLLRIRRVKPQKGNSIFFYLPKEFSMTKWQTISFSCKIAEDLNSSCLRGLNWLSVF